MVLPVKDDAVKAVPTCITTPHLKHIESYVLQSLATRKLQDLQVHSFKQLLSGIYVNLSSFNKPIKLFPST